MKLIILILCGIGILGDLGFSAPRSSMIKNYNKKLNYRLSTDVEPVDYVIELTPYFENNINGKEPFTFDGISNISLKASKSGVDTITLHKQDLKIIEQNLMKNGETITIKSTKYDEVTNKYTLKLASPLVQNDVYILNFKYIGKLQTDMHGFYRSFYREGNVTK